MVARGYASDLSDAQWALVEPSLSAGPQGGAQTTVTNFWTARRTLAGIEAMAMLTKGQVRVVPANDLPAQQAFVAGLFGLVA